MCLRAESSLWGSMNKKTLDPLLPAVLMGSVDTILIKPFKSKCLSIISDSSFVGQNTGEGGKQLV